MCGIAGIVDDRRVDPATLERSAVELRHRGPDDSTTWTSDRFGLAHTRLAIIDRAHGEQPIHTADGRYVLVFNGEIYNHAELRDELVSRGYPLAHSVRLRGAPVPVRGRGSRDGGATARHVRVRDPRPPTAKSSSLPVIASARSPCTAAPTTSTVAFASTLDALIPLLSDHPSLNPQAIAEYLVLQYMPAGVSPWEGVEKVEPGTWVRWSAGKVERRRYWRPPSPAAPFEQEVDPVRTLRPRIREAVAARLESEVPLGVFLSGGLDSSVVVAEMSELGVTPKTYSVGFEQAELDERSLRRPRRPPVRHGPSDPGAGDERRLALRALHPGLRRAVRRLLRAWRRSPSQRRHHAT